PTGSRDPYALLRGALGVIRLVLENRLRLPLLPAFATAARLQAGGRAAKQAKADGVMDELLSFFADRLKVALRERGVRHDLVDAVFALGGEDDLMRLLARVEALGAFLSTEDGANLLVAYRRAANIVRIEAKKDKSAHDGPVDAKRLREAEEKALAKALAGATAKVGPLLEAEDFAAAMGVLAALRAPVDAFFDEVTVNAEDTELRDNRLALLSQITATMNRVADFSRIEG
ncbi:MAG: glycine--tRNA ligase subunit beta, partial [Inquilinus sp.]|nr:glycine--tRNA ligase subunit beta [Inquilinus sp.]